MIHFQKEEREPPKRNLRVLYARTFDYIPGILYVKDPFVRDDVNVETVNSFLVFLSLTCFLCMSSRMLLATFAEATNALAMKYSICRLTKAVARVRRNKALACMPLTTRWIAVACILRKAAI